MVDASSALWRLFLDRVELGDRWQVLAESWQEKAFQSFYTSNDMHAMMAFVGSGDGRAGEQLIEGLKTYLSRRRDTETNYAITRDIGLPLCEALMDFGHGRYDLTVEKLLPIRQRLHEFGGSHTQRDAFERTLLEASLRAANTQVAETLLEERLLECPNSTYSLHKQAELGAMQRPI